jgi:hypothetical protein
LVKASFKISGLLEPLQAELRLWLIEAIRVDTYPRGFNVSVALNGLPMNWQAQRAPAELVSLPTPLPCCSLVRIMRTCSTPTNPLRLNLIAVSQLQRIPSCPAPSCSVMIAPCHTARAALWIQWWRFVRGKPNATIFKKFAHL